ncbi:MAG: hypothetical protein JZU65_21880 [Chlorobium sp.]|nr:hypothetical protein [Chlorobium sp.]
MMIAALLLIILLLGFFSTFISRGNLVLLLLLPSSQFLGFIDPMQIAVKGLFDIHALIVIVIFISILISINRFKLIFHAKFRVNLLVLIILWCYGVFYPYFMGYSSLFYSLKSSKEFLTIFSSVAILLFINDRKEVDLGWRYIVYLGLYYSVVEIIGQFTGPSLQKILSYVMRREDFLFTKIYLPFWPVILFSLLYSYYALSLKVYKSYSFAFVSFVGLMLTFFRSYLVATFAIVPLFLVLSGQGLMKIAQRINSLIMILTVSVILVAVIFAGGLESLEKIYDKFFASAITEITTHTGGALIGREQVVKSREKILFKSSLLGYGFIDKDSYMGNKLKHHVHGENLGFIDRGILDIPIKFGYLGFLLLIVSLVYVIVLLTKMVNKYNDKLFKVRCMSVASILIIGIIVLPVHAPFTYSFFLLPLGIAMGLIEKERSLLDTESMISC